MRAASAIPEIRINMKQTSLSKTTALVACTCLLLLDAEAQLSLESAGWHTVFPEAPMSRLSVPRTEKAPPIDGRLDHPAWKGASVAGNFVEVTAHPHEALWGIDLAEAQTAVRLLYDDEHLYLGWRCEEPNMDALKADAEDRDGPVREDDSVRFVIEMSRGGIPVRVIDLAVNAANVTFDSHTTEGHAGWTLEGVQTDVHHDGDGWQVTMALPFAGLGIDAPQPGETWWVNFGRDRFAGGPLHRETSYWAAQPQTRFAFHSYKGMGREIRFGEDVALQRADVPRPFFGTGTVTAALRNNSDQPRTISARLTLAPHGDLGASEEIELRASGTTQLEIPFTIETEGTQILYLLVEEEGEVIATARRAAYVPPVIDFLNTTIDQFERFLEETGEETELQARMRRELPRMREIREEAESLREKVAAEPVSAEAEEQWQALAQEAHKAYGRSGWFDPPALYLTWLRDPTTTMVIQWHSHDAVRHNSVQFRRADAEGEAWHTRTAWAKPAPHSDRFVHMIELGGLEPDTDYHFRFGPGLEVFTFRTMPVHTNEAITFLAGGDTMHSAEIFARTNRHAAKYEPRFALIGGDITYADGRPDRVERWYDYFDAWKRSMTTPEGRLVPKLMAIGNHEVLKAYADWGGDVENAPFFYGFFAMPGFGGYAALDFADYMSVLLLDSGHTVPIPGRQTEWLDRALAERREVPYLFPLLHVSPYPAHFPYSFPWSAQMREHWAPIFEKHGTEIVFVNHDHVFKRTHPIRDGAVAPGGVTYLGGGAWGVGILKEHPAEETWYLAASKSLRHVYVVTIQEDLRSFTVLDGDGNEFETFTINRGEEIVVEE